MLAAASLLAGAATARAEPLTIAVIGDSVAEGLHLPDARTAAPAGALRAELRRRGLRSTATGFVAANPHPQNFVWRGSWAFEGYGLHSRSPDGASGYTAVGGPGDSATATVRGDRVAILYTRTPEGATFPVTVDGRRHELDGHAPRPTVARRWLRLPRGRARVVVWGPPRGELRFTGLLARSARDDVEVLGLAHGGRRALQDTGPRHRAALRLLGVDVGVLMFGIIEGLGEHWNALADPMGELRRGLERRAAMVRETGRCVIVPPMPTDLPAPIHRAVLAAEAAAARRARCTLRRVLDRVWEPGAARGAGLLLGDGFHPTAAGYRLVARRLAQAIAPELRRRR
jgi:hypothetical protein